MVGSGTFFTSVAPLYGTLINAPIIFDGTNIAAVNASVSSGTYFEPAPLYACNSTTPLVGATFCAISGSVSAASTVQPYAVVFTGPAAADQVGYAQYCRWVLCRHVNGSGRGMSTFMVSSTLGTALTSITGQGTIYGGNNSSLFLVQDNKNGDFEIDASVTGYPGNGTQLMVLAGTGALNANGSATGAGRTILNNGNST